MGLFLMACQTSAPILVENSAKFNHSDPSTIANRDKMPSWAKDSKYQHPADGNFYAVGRSDRFPFDNELRWSQQEANAEAVSDAQNQVAQYIQIRLESLLSSTVQDTLAIEKTDRTASTRQEGRDELLMKVVSSSNVILRGLNSEDVFWEKWERIDNDGATRQFFRYFVLIRIPEDEINKERDRLAKMQDFEAEQARYFEELRREYASVKENLQRLNYRDNESFYNDEYHKLLSINTMIKNIKASDAEIQKQQAELLEGSDRDLVLYDPQDKQKQVVRSLEETIASLRVEIDKLKNDHGGIVKEQEFEIKLKEQEIAALTDQIKRTEDILKSYTADVKNEINGLHQRGITFVSQYSFFAVPSKPNENRIVSDGVPLFISDGMISNRDFISFLTMSNGSNISRASASIETPAVNLSWIEAASYCNWLSRLHGYGEYYAINGETVKPNNTNNGYRLPSRSEILAGLRNGVIGFESLVNLGIFGSGENNAAVYAYRLLRFPQAQEDLDTLLTERLVDIKESDFETGFRIVRND
jgi:uncharacterized small protein (DUF1192 family)